jgi:hypothetical protein
MQLRIVECVEGNTGVAYLKYYFNVRLERLGERREN